MTQPPGLVDIGDLGGQNTFAVALNERGVVTGTSQTDNGATHAFLYTPGVGMRDLGAGVFPSDMSEAGNLIGRLSPSNNAFFWSATGGLKDLGDGTANAFDRIGGIYGSRDGVPGRWNPAGGFHPPSARSRTHMSRGTLSPETSSARRPGPSRAPTVTLLSAGTAAATSSRRCTFSRRSRAS